MSTFQQQALALIYLSLRSTEEVREIAAKGGRVSHGGGTGSSENEESGNQTSSGTVSNNPVNFANRYV